MTKCRSMPSAPPSRRSMRTAIAWKVPTQMPPAVRFSSCSTRPRISRAALLVKVTARISLGSARPRWITRAMGCVSTRVFPLPAREKISSGPSPAVTAARCGGLSPARRSAPRSAADEIALKSSPSLASEEPVQLLECCVRSFFRQEVSGVEPATADLRRPPPPDRQHVVKLRQLAALAPEHMNGTGNPTRPVIGVVVHQIDGRAGAIVLAHRVNRFRIADAAHVLVQGLVPVQAAGRVTPPEVEAVRARADQALR